MFPAPYKVSNPEGGERAVGMDKSKIGKESWILGQCPNTYNTSAQRNFKSPKYDPASKRADNLAAKSLR